VDAGASRFYQLKTGHCLTGYYLEWTKSQPTAGGLRGCLPDSSLDGSVRRLGSLGDGLHGARSMARSVVRFDGSARSATACATLARRLALWFGSMAPFACRKLARRSLV
jgi:hypothetical protein